MDIVNRVSWIVSIDLWRDELKWDSISQQLNNSKAIIESLRKEFHLEHSYSVVFLEGTKISAGMNSIDQRSSLHYSNIERLLRRRLADWTVVFSDQFQVKWKTFLLFLLLNDSFSLKRCSIQRTIASQSMFSSPFGTSFFFVDHLRIFLSSLFVQWRRSRKDSFVLRHWARMYQRWMGISSP